MEIFVQLKDVLVCDDIRYELGNKFSLNGLYADKIKFSRRGEGIKFPIMLRLGLMIRLALEEKEAFPPEFIVEYKLNGEQIAKVEGNLNVIQPDESFLSIPMVLNLQIAKFGVLNFNLSFLKDGKIINEFKEIHPLQLVELKGPL